MTHLFRYFQPGVGLEAINDSYFLEGAIYILLKKYCKGKSYYVDLLELFHEVWWIMCWCHSIVLLDLGMILGLHPANERWGYFVTASLIGWAPA